MSSIWEVIMKHIFFSTLLLTISLSACTKPTEIKDNIVTVEATVDYQRSETATGGEVDPTGFILKNVHWNSNEPPYPYYRVYVGGIVDSSYLNRLVKISGSLDSIVCMGVERGKRVFPFISAQQITTLN